MPSNYLADDDLAVRYVAHAKLRRDEDGVVLGPLGEAFKMRDNEEYLSVTWCEYFEGSVDERTRCAIEAIRRSFNCRPSGHFARGIVGEIRKLVEERGRTKLRIIHEPEEDNPAHAAVRHWPRDDFDLLEQLAADAWSELISAEQADALPPSACRVSDRV